MKPLVTRFQLHEIETVPLGRNTYGDSVTTSVSSDDRTRWQTNKYVTAD